MISGTLQKRLLLLVGGVFLYMGGMDLVHGWQSRAWPSVTGQLTDFAITPPAAPGGNPVVLKLKYSYQVDNKRHTGERIRFGPDLRKTGAEAGYAAGQTVPVFYNPNHPQSSVLHPGISLGSLWQTLVGTFTVSMSLILFWVKFAMRRLLWGVFLCSVGSGPLVKSGEALVQALARGDMPPLTASAGTALGGSMTFMGIRRVTSGFRDLVYKFKSS